VPADTLFPLGVEHIELCAVLRVEVVAIAALYLMIRAVAMVLSAGEPGVENFAEGFLRRRHDPYIARLLTFRKSCVMVSSMKPPKPTRNVRAYIRPMRDYSEAAQRKDLEPMQPTAFYVEKPVTRDDATDYRAAWIETLRASEGAVAVVARLWVLPKPRLNGSGMRPSADFIATLAEIHARGVPLVEAASGVSSQDLPAWRALMQKVARRIAVGRGHSPRTAARIGKLGGKAVRERSISRKWLAPEMAEERKKAGRIWRDPALENEAAALAELPKEIATRALAYKILGKRRPRLKTGRPRKSAG